MLSCDLSCTKLFFSAMCDPLDQAKLRYTNSKYDHSLVLSILDSSLP